MEKENKSYSGKELEVREFLDIYKNASKEGKLIMTATALTVELMGQTGSNTGKAVSGTTAEGEEKGGQ